MPGNRNGPELAFGPASEYCNGDSSLPAGDGTWPFLTLLKDPPPVLCFGCAAPCVHGMCDTCLSNGMLATQRLDLQRLPELNTDTLTWAAYFYARAGIPVLPLKPGSKMPATRHGVDDATTDTRPVRAWWRDCPTFNIGLATGVVFDGLDVDVKDGAPGAESFTRLQEAGLTQGAWAAATTPSGGRHVLFVPSGDGNHANGRTGLDFRGRKGFIVATPSVIDAGSYQWEFSDPDARSRPFDWQAAMVHLGAAAAQQPQAVPDVFPGRPTAKSLAGILRFVASQSPTGHNRDEAIRWAAYRLIEGGYPPAAWEAVADAARSTGQPEREVRRALREYHRGGVSA